MRADVANGMTPGAYGGTTNHREQVAAAVTKSHRLNLVINNTLISLAGQVVTWTSTLILTMAYGRFLGPVGLGELYLAVTLTGLIGFPLEFGFNQQIIREVAVAEHRAQHYVSTALALKVALWAPLCALLIGMSFILRYGPEERIVVALAGVTLLVTSIGAAFGAMQVAIHRNIIPATGLIIEKGLDAAIAFVLLRYFHAGVITVAFVLLAGAALNSSWQAIWFYRRVPLGFSFDMATIREIMKTSVPFLLYGVLGVIYYRIDTVLLGAMDGDRVVGLYGAGYKIFDTLIFLPGLVMSTVMYPLMARLSKDDPKAFRVAIDKSMNFLLICGLPLATGLGFGAPAIVGFLYHHESFGRTVVVMEALAPGLILLYINSVIGNIIITMRREKSLVWMAAVALVLNLGLNLLLIPRYQEAAAAGVTSVTELALLIMGLFALPRHLIPIGSLPTLLKALAASGAMALVIVALGHFSILLMIPTAAATYAAVGVALRLIPREDLRALLAAARQKASRQPSSVAQDIATPALRGASAVDGMPGAALAALDTGENTAPIPAVRAAASAAHRVGELRRAPRSIPLAHYYAISSPAERARLVTRTGPLSTRGSTHGKRDVWATLTRHATPSQPLRKRELAPLVA